MNRSTDSINGDITSHSSSSSDKNFGNMQLTLKRDRLIVATSPSDTSVSDDTVSSAAKRTVLLDDIINIEVHLADDGKVLTTNNDGYDSLILHTYIRVPEGCVSDAGRVYEELEIKSRVSGLVSLWRDKLYQLQPTLATAKKRFLILINPHSGAGLAVRKWSKCEPVFKYSGHSYTVLRTTHMGHAHEYVAALPVVEDPESKTGKRFRDYDAIVTCSGDGLLSEVLQGVMSRPDWMDLVMHTTFGIIPCGSGNGLAKALAEVSNEHLDAVSMAFLIVRGQTRRIDLFSCAPYNPESTEPPKPFFGFLGWLWGIISDIDFESEVLRCIGGARFTVWAIIRFLNLRYYTGKLSYVPEAHFHPDSDAKDVTAARKGNDASNNQFSVCADGRNCTACMYDEDQISASLHELKAYLSSDGKSPYGEEEWVHVDSNYILASAMSLSWPASDLCTTPFCHLSDGLLDLLYVDDKKGDPGLFDLAEAFIEIEDGSHMKNRHANMFEYVKVKQMRMIPGPCTTNENQISQLNVDGELIDYGPIDLRVFQSVLNVFSV